jgi:hypothetical protein
VNEPVDPPSSIRPVPPALEKAVLRALEKDPAKRFGSVKVLEDALEASTESATMPLPVAAGEPTAPVERVDATAPIRRADVTAPVQRAMPTGHRRARSFPWAVVGAVVLGLLVVAALAMALGPSDPQQAARQAARDANQQQTEEPTDSPTESPTTVLEPPTVDDAYASLVAAIAQAEGAGQIDEKLGGELGDRADRAYEAYQAGDPEEVQKQLEEFGQKLAEATDKGEVPVEAADGIQSSFNDFVLAIQNDPGEVPPSSDEHPSDDHGHGHGNANEHDED